MWFAGLGCLVLMFGCGFGLRLGGVLCLGVFWVLVFLGILVSCGVGVI